MSAASAMSAIVVAAKPRSAKRRNAASSIASRVRSFFRSRRPMHPIVATVAFCANLHWLHFCVECANLPIMHRLAAFAHDRRRLVAAAWIALVVSAGVLAVGVGTGYVSNFTLPGTESQRAADLLKHRFPQHAADSRQSVYRV